MMKQSLVALALALPLAATEMPPMVDSGPVYYDDVIYQDAAPAPQAPAYTAPAPVQPAASGNANGEIVINAYTTNYQVRGMGVTNPMSNCGYSSISGSWTLPNRNILKRGIHQRISGTWGTIWGADEALGDTPLFNVNYALGKELLPNLVAEVGYSFHRGGLEGYMVRATKNRHRVAQDLNATISFNDRQKGFFGHATWGVGFQGLTGSFFDLEGGWRFTDVFARPNMTSNFGADLELSAGLSASFGYWGGDVEGVDAYRLRAALLPFSHKGTFGRDSRLHITPWAQLSWTGHNASKIDRRIGYGPIDHCQFTFGLDLGWKF